MINSDQGIDAGVSGDVDEVLVEFTPGNSERPLGGRVEDGSERDTDADKHEVGQCQTQHDRVGRRPQAMIAGNGRHDRQVPEEAEHRDDAEDDRYDVTEHPADPAVRRSRTEVCRVRLVDEGRVERPASVGTRVVVVGVSGVELDVLGGGRRRIHDA